MGGRAHRRSRTTFVAQDLQTMPHTCINGDGATLPKSRHRASRRVICHTRTSIIRNTDLWIARAAIPRQRPVSRAPTCYSRALRPAARAIILELRQRNLAALSATRITTLVSANRRTVIFGCVSFRAVISFARSYSHCPQWRTNRNHQFTDLHSAWKSITLS